MARGALVVCFDRGLIVRWQFSPVVVDEAGQPFSQCRALVGVVYELPVINGIDPAGRVFVGSVGFIRRRAPKRLAIIADREFDPIADRY